LNALRNYAEKRRNAATQLRDELAVNLKWWRLAMAGGRNR
jgi:hypothetical protein